MELTCVQIWTQCKSNVSWKVASTCINVWPELQVLQLCFKKANFKSPPLPILHPPKKFHKSAYITVNPFSCSSSTRSPIATTKLSIVLYQRGDICFRYLWYPWRTAIVAKMLLLTSAWRMSVSWPGLSPPWRKYRCWVTRKSSRASPRNSSRWGNTDIEIQWHNAWKEFHYQPDCV